MQFSDTNKYKEKIINMQREDLANSIASRGFTCFILATVLIIRTIIMDYITNSSIGVIAIEIIMSILCITIGILALSLKSTLAKNASILRRCIRITLLIWIILGALFVIFDFISAPSDIIVQVRVILFSWLVIFILGLLFFLKFFSTLNFYIKASNFEQSGQNECMADDYPYIYAQSDLANQPMPGPKFINPPPQNENPYIPPPQIPPFN